MSASLNGKNLLAVTVIASVRSHAPTTPFMGWAERNQTAWMERIAWNGIASLRAYVAKAWRMR